ncbi:hypothetical protein LINGRAHAP2_LOCUS24251 [Linum grandiflorum]
MVVWFRFPRLPYQYYHCDVLEGLGNLVGKFIRFDTRTQHSVRGKFARIAVEIDLTVPASKGVFVDGVWQVIEYENLPSFCRTCGRFGHSVENCDQRHISTDVIEADPPPHVDPPVDGALPSDDLPTEPDGQWHTVTRKKWRPKKETRNQPNGSTPSMDLGKGKPIHITSKGVNHGIHILTKSAYVKRPALEMIAHGPLHSAQSRPAHGTKNTNELASCGLSSKEKKQIHTGGSIFHQGHVSKAAIKNISDGLTSKPIALSQQPSIQLVVSNPLFSLGLIPDQPAPAQPIPLPSKDSPSLSNTSPMASSLPISRLPSAPSSDVQMADFSSSRLTSTLPTPTGSQQTAILDFSKGFGNRVSTKKAQRNRKSTSLKGFVPYNKLDGAMTQKSFSSCALWGMSTRRVQPNLSLRKTTRNKSRKVKVVNPIACNQFHQEQGLPVSNSSTIRIS